MRVFMLSSIVPSHVRCTPTSRIFGACAAATARRVLSGRSKAALSVCALRRSAARGGSCWRCISRIRPSMFSIPLTAPRPVGLWKGPSTSMKSYCKRSCRPVGPRTSCQTIARFVLPHPCGESRRPYLVDQIVSPVKLSMLTVTSPDCAHAESHGVRCNSTVIRAHLAMRSTRPPGRSKDGWLTDKR
jgi:hypothetical protein